MKLKAALVSRKHRGTNSKDWKLHWRSRGQPWRTEPEIGRQRQRELTRLRFTPPDISRGVYPFSNRRLTRGDIEWLLATHDGGKGPIDWRNSMDQRQIGLDLRGADLRDIDLSHLPLTGMRGGLSGDEWHQASVEERHMAGIHLERSKLTDAHLEGSILTHSHLRHAAVNSVHFEAVDAFEADFTGTNWANTYFDASSKLERIRIADDTGVGPRLFGVHWGGAILSAIDWSAMQMVADEHIASRRSDNAPTPMREERRTRHLEEATQTYRQLNAVLAAQGLAEDAAHFAHRAQIVQRKVYWRRHRWTQYAFSLFVNVLAGYGYRLRRCLAAYLTVIGLFSMAYYMVGFRAGIPLTPLEAAVFSMTSFHGRGFSPVTNIGIDNPLTMLAAAEALVGLIIEVTLIATLTQRFFGK